ncbi:class I SAM-dependent methyltransferase [Bradyrhizobium sp. USDA 10063]
MKTMNSTLLNEINRELPKGVDWKAGARTYVQEAIHASGAETIISFGLTKPMYRLNPGPDMRGLEMALQYLFNFANVLKLLQLPAESRLMDVACGAGWMSHYLNRFGYRTFGFDISSDFIDLAKRRLKEDPYLKISAERIDGMFAVLDIETESLGREHLNNYDAIVLESCLHHFFDPIAALSNLAPCLRESGVIVLIEGENRTGEIKKVYLDEMEAFRTIERPYERSQLKEVLKAAGLPHFEFLGQLNGFFSVEDPIYGDATARLREVERGMNLCVCATNRAAIDRLLPNLCVPQSAPIPESDSPVPSAPNFPWDELEYLRKRESELVRLVTAITSSKGWRALEYLKRLAGR